MAGAPEALSEREKEVLRLMTSGHTAKSAANALDLSVHTINDHLREARKKLGVSSSREAARALAALERLPPKKSAPHEMGMVSEQISAQQSPANPPPGSKSKIAAWVIAGAIMFATILSLVMFAASTPGPATKALPEQSDIAAADRTVGNAALGWIGLVDRGRYQESWQAAGGTFRAAVSAADWTKSVEPVRKPLGAVVRRTLLDVTSHSELPGAPVGDYRMVRFSTEFTKAPGAVETVVMQREGSNFRVVGYFVK